jgi:centrosomal protein POC5
MQKVEMSHENKINETINQVTMTANKEIESLRYKLEDAIMKIDIDTREKQNIQDNLKRAFVRGLCSMNQDAMNILGFTPRNDYKNENNN